LFLFFISKHMNHKRVLLTQKGSERLTQELKQLKSVDRPAVIAAISEARAQGDLSENAEYDAARERQGFIEGRIQYLESILSTAEIITPNEEQAGGRVVFGATVTVEDLNTEKQERYQIVGEDESDISRNLISIQAPIAKALIGKEAGDVVEFKVPQGQRELEIISVEYVS
jgi:transcription elongation factor GreA